MTFSASRHAGHHHDINTQNSRSMGRKRGRRASEHGQLMLQSNALPNQCPAGTTICPGSFSGIVVEPNHWESLCPTRTIRQRSGSGEVLRCHGAGGEGVASFGR
jgi:hypothetical protein